MPVILNKLEGMPIDEAVAYVKQNGKLVMRFVTETPEKIDPDIFDYPNTIVLCYGKNGLVNKAIRVNK